MIDSVAVDLYNRHIRGASAGQRNRIETSCEIFCKMIGWPGLSLLSLVGPRSLLSLVSLVYLLSDQAMLLYIMEKTARNGRFSVLGNTFQRQKHGCKNFGIP